MTASRVATCARAAPLQAVVDLVLEQFGRLVEQVDRDQPVGEPADHLVAAAADRGQLADIVEQASASIGCSASPLPARNKLSKVPAASSWILRVSSELGCASMAARMTWKASR